MLIVVNATFPMFSFCYLALLYMFRRGAREAVRGVSCFPTDRTDLHRCRSGCCLFSTQIAPLAPRSKREFCYNVTCYNPLAELI